MRRSWLILSATILGAAALLLALGDTVLMVTNRSVRHETDEQRQFLQQTAQFNGVNEKLVRQIARIAVEDKDQALRDLLVAHGFKIQTEPMPGQAPAPPEKK